MPNESRDKAIYHLKKHKTYEKLAEIFNLSADRIKQICKKQKRIEERQADGQR